MGWQPDRSICLTRKRDTKRPHWGPPVCPRSENIGGGEALSPYGSSSFRYSLPKFDALSNSFDFSAPQNLYAPREGLRVFLRRARSKIWEIDIHPCQNPSKIKDLYPFCSTSSSSPCDLIFTRQCFWSPGDRDSLAFWIWEWTYLVCQSGESESRNPVVLLKVLYLRCHGCALKRYVAQIREWPMV